MKKECFPVLTKIFVGICALFVCSGCLHDLLNLDSQMESDLSAKELILRMNHATDPKKEYFNCKSYRMRQSLSVLESGTKDLMSLEICFQAPDKIRITNSRNGKPTVVEIYNGGKAWTIDCGTGRVKRVPAGLQLDLMRIYTQTATPSLSALQIFRKVDVDMNVDENGVKTYRLVCDAGIRGIAPYVYYINGHTFLQERMETVMYAGLNESLYVSIPTDYKWFGNVYLPGVSTVKIMKTTRISKMTDFELNVDFPDYYFRPEIRRGRIVLPKAPEEKKVSAVPSAGKKSAAPVVKPAVKKDVKSVKK